MKPRPFSPLEEYAYQCGRAGVPCHVAETLATLARAIRRHSEAGCNRVITPQEERIDAKRQAVAVALSGPGYTVRIDDSALTSVYIDVPDTAGRPASRSIFVPPVLS